MRIMLRIMLKRRMRSNMKKRRMEMLPEVLALKISFASKLWIVVPVPRKCDKNVLTTHVFLSAKWFLLSWPKMSYAISNCSKMTKLILQLHITVSSAKRKSTCRRATWNHGRSVPEFHRCSLRTPSQQYLIRVVRIKRQWQRQIQSVFL